MKIKAKIELHVTVEAKDEKNAIYLLRGVYETGEICSCCYSRNDIDCRFTIHSRKVTLARTEKKK